MKPTLDLLPLLGYAAGLYVLTGVVKALLRAISAELAARCKRYETIMPVLLGMITAPTVLPWALGVMGLKTGEWPLAAAVLSGATAGALSSKMWDIIHKLGAQWLRARLGGKEDSPDTAE